MASNSKLSHNSNHLIQKIKFPPIFPTSHQISKNFKKKTAALKCGKIAVPLPFL
jgi:hypothetical protein